MINIKSVTLGCGIIASLTLFLSGCEMMDGMNYHRENTEAPTTMTTPSNTPTHTAKKVSKSAAKEPIQQTTPGPKRTAAPQIPVIQ